jgi:hypothetical protein
MERRISMKKLLIIILALTILFTVTISTHTHANPYCTYKGGNCTYFTWECVDTYWGMTPNIPREWDAYRWAELIGQEKDGYRIEQVTEPTIGDIFVLPQTEEFPLGHTGMIVGETWNLCLEDGTYETSYKVVESGMYAEESEFMFPYEFKGCRYRYHNYWNENLEGAVFLRCVKKE